MEASSTTISTAVLPLIAMQSRPRPSSCAPSSKSSSAASSRSASDTPASASQPESDDLAVEQGLSRLTVSDTITAEKEKPMFSALRAIVRQANPREVGINVDLDQLHAIFERADQSDQHGYKDIEALGSLRGILDQMWWHGSELMSAVAKVLADGSRDRESRALGHLHPSVLQFMLMKSSYVAHAIRRNRPSRLLYRGGICE